MTRKTSISLVLAGTLLASSLFAAQQINSASSSETISPIGNAGNTIAMTANNQPTNPSPYASSQGRNSNSPAGLQGIEVGGDDIVIPNAPIITPDRKSVV